MSNVFSLWMAFVVILFYSVLPTVCAVQLDSQPSLSNLYHIKLGNKIHIGQLPMQLNAADFNNNNSARFVIYKPGYKPKYMNIDLSREKMSITLKKSERWVTVSDAGNKGCAVNTKRLINRYIENFRAPLLVQISNPIDINTSKGIVRVESRIFDRHLSKKIKSLKRKRDYRSLDKALNDANAALLLGLLRVLKKTCTPQVELIAYIGGQTNKRIRVPYLDHYYDVSTYTSTNYVTGLSTKTTVTSSGNYVAYKDDIIKKRETYFRRFLYNSK